MSYLVLARKWRPQSFDDLIGQEHVNRTLGNAIASGRVHHAFLFTGARGVGKTSAARIFAKALNCEHGPTVSPCNQCPLCEDITAGRSVDVLEIDGASNTGVDDVRELRESIRYMPSQARYKIIIIDEVHMLSTSAFNALLKTLEEPPPHVKFIFATTEPHKIPVTILSRCQRFDFRKVSLRLLQQHLRQIVDREGVAISERALALVARRGEGSVRDALSALDQVIAFCGERIEDADVQLLFGQVDRRLLLDAVEALLERDSRRALDAVRRIDHHGYSFRQFCRELVEVLRTLTLLKVVEDASGLVDAGEDELAELRRLGEPVALEDLERLLTLLLKTEAELALASFPRLTLELALVRLTRLAPARDVSALIRKLETLEQRLGSEPLLSPGARVRSPVVEAPPAEEPLPPPESAPPAAEPPRAASARPVASGGEKNWAGLMERLRKKKPLLATMLEHGSLLPLRLPEVEIAFERDSFHFNQLRDSEQLEQLQQLIGEYFGEPVRVRIVARDESQGEVPPSLVESRRAYQLDREESALREARAHPKVRAVMEILEGEIRQVKPLEPTEGVMDRPEES